MILLRSSSLFFLFFVFFSSSSVVFSQNEFDWNSNGGDGLWTNSTLWTSSSASGFPNSSNDVANVDVNFGTGTVNVTSSVTVSKLIVGPGCGSVQIIQHSNNTMTRLTVQTNSLDSSEVSITGTVIGQPISISVGDPYVNGRIVFVTVRTELGDEVKTFQLGRPSSTEGWFYGSFETVQGDSCPNNSTILCVNGPQGITVSYVAPLTGETHNATFDIQCADFSDFTVSEVEWMVMIDSTQLNYEKLLNLQSRLSIIQTDLNSRSYAENIYYYKTIAEQSFVLGSQCFEEYCSSVYDLAHKLSMDGGQVPDQLPLPLLRDDPQIEY